MSLCDFDHHPSEAEARRELGLLCQSRYSSAEGAFIFIRDDVVNELPPPPPLSKVSGAKLQLAEEEGEFVGSFPRSAGRMRALLILGLSSSLARYGGGTKSLQFVPYKSCTGLRIGL